MFADREAFFAATKRRFREIDVPVVGRVKIRSLKEIDRQQLDRDVLKKDGSLREDRYAEARLRLIVASVVDADGNLVFTDEDLPKLRELDYAVTRAIEKACLEHQGADADEIKELAKNSEAINGSDSSAD